jgi:hypothetical protein
VDGNRAVETAIGLGVGVRIGSRIEVAKLRREVGDEAAEVLRQSSLSVAARAVLVGQVCDELAGAAAAAGVPIVLLKGAALLAGGYISADSRAMADVDVLVDQSHAAQLKLELENRGFSGAEPLGSDHDLLLVVHESGLAVEGHRWIPGLAFENGTSATASALIRRGHCVGWRPGSKCCLLPNRIVLMAHTLAHGIAQHGLAPDKYPMLRMLADLQDLAPGETEWRPFEAAAGGWLDLSVSADEICAVRYLLRRLTAAEDLRDLVEASEREALILRHVIAGATDETYRKAIRVQHRMVGASGDAKLSKAMDVVRSGLFLNRAQIDHIYGQPRWAFGYLALRLWRPFHLAVRACRYSWAWARLRWFR